MRKSELKNILVTGNLGYIGSVLSPMLSDMGYSVTGYDTQFYGDECLLYNSPQRLFKQIRKDIRDVDIADMEDIDAIIHLASLSNDPLAEFMPEVTEDINFRGTIKFAELAKKSGIKRFVYASSQSMYGISDTKNEIEEDNSEKNPLTVYAETKWKAECELNKLGDDNFIVVSFRPSTVFGLSPKLRCDIVYNNLVACAYTTGRIEIKSDGTPWRPVVHVRDVCKAFITGLTAPSLLVAKESFNVGIPDGNFTVRQLAETASKAIPGSRLIFTGEHGPDSRTYRVSFKKILDRLKDYYRPEWNLISGADELVAFFEKCNFSEADFRGGKCNRLPCLKQLVAEKKLGPDLRWKI